ncbi:MAG: PIG-L family deacetylase [Longimicrobiales bacterium]
MPFRRILLTVTTTIALGSAGVASPSAGQATGPAGMPTAAASATAAYHGAAATGLALRRLGTTARVLHIAAHPDDENTALFAPLALGRGIDAAYLSLTRGEGGQNGIGPELGVALGLIRSEELLAARRLDGGSQFFARAIDYGYSKSAEEAFRHWPKDSLLADVVEVIRRYRPDVIASVWSGTPRDGHGQHEATGIVAREAFLAAGDPARFPEQIDAGLRPHSPKLYYRSAWFAEGPPDVELNTGVLDPLLGASYHQIAMASRSLHRSQDQGRRLDPGPRRTGFDRVDDPAGEPEVAEDRSFDRYGQGAADATPSMFDGVDTLLSQRARQAAELLDGLDRRAMEETAELLEEYEALVAEVRDAFNPLRPWALVPTLSRAQDRLATVAAGLEAMGSNRTHGQAVRDLHHHFRHEFDDLRTALLGAANVHLDVIAEEAVIVPGQTFRLEVSVWNGGPDAIRADAGPLLPDGWRAQRAESGAAEGRLTVEPGQRAVVAYDVTVPDHAAFTMPYYLDPRGPEPVDMYRWPDMYADRAGVRGLPFAPPPVRGSFLISLAGVGTPIPAELDAARVAVDARSGQYREPVKVVPAVSVAVEPDLAVVRAAEPEPFDVTVRLRSQAPDGAAGELRLTLPPGWRASPDRIPARLDEEGAERSLTFEVRPPRNTVPDEYEIGARLEAGAAGESEGATYTLGYDVVDYPHIAPHHLYHTATVRARVMDVAVADVHVGYVPGSGDGVPEALDQLGVRWETLDPGALAAADFDRFDVIVTGTRAYEVNDHLVAHNQKLLDWVRGGGTVIVQYNKYPALRRSYAPWPVTIARPHGRVTDETAPVRVLEPGHAVLNAPNRIGPRDWEGWVQERGLYFWETWPDTLTPLLAMSDPGEDDLRGSLLVGPLGEGTYVYAALAFFRQLPEGVPGAYRLFANLLSLGAP